jgi:hypothetical protein
MKNKTNCEVRHFRGARCESAGTGGVKRITGLGGVRRDLKKHQVSLDIKHRRTRSFTKERRIGNKEPRVPLFLP